LTHPNVLFLKKKKTVADQQQQQQQQQQKRRRCEAKNFCTIGRATERINAYAKATQTKTSSE
jgi:sulfatase maturation enzyme AslB (radical SAM superfamily)